MCGIFAYLNLIHKNNKIKLSNDIFENFNRIRNRGPEYSCLQLYDDIIIGFHRLAILNTNYNGNQPYILESKDKKIIFICNGEIYNFNELIDNYNLDIHDNSDCLVVPKLYLKYEDSHEFNKLFNNTIIGEFSFLLIDLNDKKKINKVIVGRDTVGVRPLYFNENHMEELVLCSEIKGLNFYNDNIKEFPPGTIMTYNDNSVDFYHYTTIYRTLPEYSSTEEVYLFKIRIALINSVKRRLISDKPLGCLLSGGIDSSLVSAITSSIIKTKLNTFCCGMEKGTDLKYANMVSKHIDSNHSELIFTSDSAFNKIPEVIHTIESWDTTTVRASVGQYLISEYISNNTNIKVLLVGEGADEICSSYLFNFNAPTDNELHQCAIEYVKDIHYYDVKRADRCIANFGLEARVPFLDPEFIAAYWSVPAYLRHPKYKGIEKWWLRKAFEPTNLLPHEVLWRQKEAFSDGISKTEKSWYEIIDEKIREKFKCSVKEYEKSSDPTLEAYHYKKLFIKFFGRKRLNIIPKYWQPKWTNSKNYIDPSARVLKVYKKNKTSIF